MEYLVHHIYPPMADSREHLRNEPRDACAEDLRDLWYPTGRNPMIPGDPVVRGANRDVDELGEPSDGQSGGVERPSDAGTGVVLRLTTRLTSPTFDDHSSDCPLLTDASASTIVAISAIDGQNEAYEDGLPPRPTKLDSLIITRKWQLRGVERITQELKISYEVAGKLVGCSRTTLHDLLTKPEKEGGRSSWVRRISGALEFDLPDVESDGDSDDELVASVLSADEKHLELVRTVLATDDDDTQMVGTLLALRSRPDICELIIKSEHADADTIAAIRTLLRDVTKK